MIVILFGLNLCAGSRENSFQEVLKAVLFGGWSIPPTAYGWLLRGSPIRVSMTFILFVGLILFALARISNNSGFLHKYNLLNIFLQIGYKLT